MSAEFLDRLRLEQERHREEDIRIARLILSLSEDEYNQTFSGTPGSLDYEDAQDEAQEILAKYRGLGYAC